MVRLDRGQETLLTSLPNADAPERFAEYRIRVSWPTAPAATAKLQAGSPWLLLHLVVTLGKWNLRINEEIADEVVDRADGSTGRST